MNLKFRKGMSMIEMIAVIIIMVILLAFIVSRLVNFNPFDKEGNIPTLLKDYVSAVKLAHTNDINTLKSISFKKLFVDQGDGGTNTQGFVKVISNCHYEPSEFVTAQTDFTSKFKIAAVWNTQSVNFPIQPIDNIRSVLNKLWEWRMYFAAGKKSELINKQAKEYKSIGDYVYVILIEHSKANRAEFKSDKLESINQNGSGAVNYYNAVVLDSAGMIYDGLNSQYMIRSLLWATPASGTSFDELVDFDNDVINNIKTKATPVCLS